MSEIYDYEQRLARYKRTIAGLRNGEIALRLLDHLASLGLSEAALSNSASHLIAVLRLIDFDVKDATRSDVERVVAAINRNKRWTESTKHHKRMILRRLIQFAKCGSCDRSTPFPPEVSWLKLRRSEKDSRVTPEALLTRENFEAMVKAAGNPRDRAMVYTLFEGALRPGELLSMTVSSVEFHKEYCVISVKGKTGLKRLPLVAAYKPLLQWFELHPKKEDPNAPLWCSLANGRIGERLSYRHFRLIIKRLAEKAGLRKAVWPYLFRHSTLTALAKVFTEARLEQYAGWTHGTKMSARYVHFSARDLEDAVLELYGLKAPGDEAELQRLVTCPRCKERNPPGVVYCTGCGMLLDKELAIKREEARADEVAEVKREISQMKDKFAQIEQLIRQLASQHASQGRQELSPAPQPSAAAPQEPSSAQGHVPQTSAPPESSQRPSLKGGF